MSEPTPLAEREFQPGAAMPMVLLPGTLCDGRVFAPLVERLVGHDVRVMPITGASSASALAQAVLAAAPPRFVLAGFSLGGMVAMQVAAASPHRVLGLALIASNARPDLVGADTRRADLAKACAAGLGAFLRDRLWARSVGRAARNDAGLQRLLVDMAETTGAAGLAEQTEVAITRTDSRERLKDLHMPVLVLGGEEDVICPPEMQREIAQAAPNVTLHIVPGVGHFVLLEAPEMVARYLLDWLARLPTQASSDAQIDKRVRP